MDTPNDELFELIQLILRLMQRHPEGSDQNELLSSMMAATLAGQAQPGLYQELKVVEDRLNTADQDEEVAELQLAIKQSLQPLQEADEDSHCHEDDEAAELERAIAMSLHPDHMQDEAEDEALDGETDMDEDLRYAIELSMDQDEEPSIPTQSIGLWGIVVDSPETSVSVEHQQALTVARREKGWMPRVVDAVEGWNSSVANEDLYEKLRSLAKDLEQRHESDDNLLQLCRLARTIAAVDRSRVGEQLNILQNAVIELENSDNSDIMRRLQQAIEHLRTMVGPGHPLAGWLDATVVPHASEQPDDCLREVQQAIAKQEKRKRLWSSRGLEGERGKRMRSSGDVVATFVHKLDGMMLRLSSVMPTSYAIIDILDRAKRLRSHTDGLPSNTDGTIAHHNSSFLHLAGLVLQAATFLINPPTSRTNEVRFFQFLETARRSAGTYFANIVRRPEEEQAFRIVDGLVTAIVNEVIEGTTLHEEYQNWQGERVREAAAQADRMRAEHAIFEEHKMPKNFDHE